MEGDRAITKFHNFLSKYFLANGRMTLLEAVTCIVIILGVIINAINIYHHW